MSTNKFEWQQRQNDVVWNSPAAQSNQLKCRIAADGRQQAVASGTS